MNEITPLAFIASATVVMVVVFVLLHLFFKLISRRWNKHKAETVDKWEAEGIEFVRGPTGARFGGLESMGIDRVLRGIGLVLITDKDLRVTRSSPLGTWCVPFKQIKGVTIQPAFMGHRGKTPFIVVRFKKEGEADKLGFQVKDCEAWASDLAEAAGVRVKDKR